MLLDTVIRNGAIVSPEKTIKGNLGIKDGRIQDIYPPGQDPGAGKIIDASGKYVIPGLIDSHVHLGLIEPFEKDCATESRAAAIGGVTLMVSHLISEGDYRQLIVNNKKTAEENSLVHFAFHAGIMSDPHIEQMSDCQDLGVNSFKLYMAYKGKEGSRLKIKSADDRLIYRCLKEAASTGGLVMAHAENMDIIFERYPVCESIKDLSGWDEARPGFCEAQSAASFLFMAQDTGARAGIVHVSSPLTMEVIRFFRNQGYDALAEACPQYLCLHHDEPFLMEEPLTAKITPPVRRLKDNLSLWEAMERQEFDLLGTDHCSNLASRKLGEDIWSTRPGFPGMDSYLPVLLSEGVNKNRITINQLVELAACGNAKNLGFWPEKGNLKPGADADIVIVDMDLTKEFRPGTGFSDFSPFQGWKLKGWPVMTIIDGKVIAEDGKILPETPGGRFSYMHCRQPNSCKL